MEPCPPSNTAKNLKNSGRRTATNVKFGEGKSEMLVMNNVCHKLVHRIFACVSRREKCKQTFA